jgi:tight adherence protein B
VTSGAGAAGLLIPLALALGAAAAAWLLVGATLGVRHDERRRRRRRTALITGDRSVSDPRDEPVAKRDPTSHHGSVLKRPRFPSANDWLRHAGVAAGAGPFVLLVLALAAGGAAAGAMTHGAIGLLAGALLAPGVLVLGLDRRRKARRARMNALLPDLLQVLAGALVAGQSFLQALDQTANEIPEPLREELLITLSEVELGEPLEAALEHLRARAMDDDLDLVIDAVLIQRRIGGNLSEILQNIGWTIRERIRIRGEVRSLTGQARMSSWVLGGLPVVMAGGLALINPAYMAPLLKTPAGHAMLIGAIISEAIGMVIMRRIANVRV